MLNVCFSSSIAWNSKIRPRKLSSLSYDYQTVVYKESRDDWRRAEIVVTTVQSLLFNNKYQRLFYAVQDLKANKGDKNVSEQDLLEYILDWKKAWGEDEEKKAEVASTIRNLEMLGWVRLNFSESLPVFS
jgi:hypothetical protein